ncbi:type VII secretion protein EccCb [Mycolicibacterium sp. P9-22]|uniref:type VII secretion protein EccCb n=1 Tax=Mycolicibacterium sp. P9-22 TaxID=2024613 RepID=UPI0011EE7D69|nr:type VII secretion protein EccCb [Mycolicibacterium sp. P9-22]KAA0118304.1 type VII secretion protein EccCb [Mycolicibacterium sp. P9-22]
MEFVREKRLPAPPVPDGEVALRRPPEVPVAEPASPLARLLPVLMLVAVGGMVVLYLSSPAGPGATPSRNPMYMIFPVTMVLSVLGTLAHTARGRTAELNAGRRDYLRYLDTVAAETGETAWKQHVSAHWSHPDPTVLWTLVGGRRMWERRSGDPDFCRVRIGLGPAPLATRLTVASADPIAEPDPVTAAALEWLLVGRSVVSDLPVTVAAAGHLGFDGEPGRVRDLVRALICQLAVLHGPDEVSVTGPAGPCWDWLKWLPHHAVRPDAGGPRRMVAILDGDTPAPVGADVTVLDLNGGGDTVIELAALGHVDGLSPAQARMCARRLSRWRAGPDAGAAHTTWTSLIGAGAAADLDPAAGWRPRRDPERLRVPIGVGDGADNRAEPVFLDIKEAAEGGMGPHGLCVGATGSGKSEFLRTLILGLVASHSPDDLNLALIDFKGGATFLGFERLSHVSAVITNLDDEAYLVNRMHDALSGEMNRRQQVLRAAGNLGNISAYRRARSARSDLPALPVLFIVIDEFSELLSQRPDFAELFVAIGRLGRSLGMHLLLASQRLDEGRLRGLETHLSYRVCLKTFSASESRAVLGVPDAYELPAAPGAAYLKTSDGRLVRLRTTYVSGPENARGAPDLRPRLFTSAPEDDADGAAVRGGTAATVLEAALNRLAGHGNTAHRLWLPALPACPALEELLTLGDGARLTAPIGLVDNAFAQRRDLLTVDLNGAGGHVAVVGATRSGKSTALCTLLLALAATHSPTDVQFYCLDFGGGTLAALQHLPHTGVIAGRGDRELVRRTVAQLQALIRRRSDAVRTATPDGYGEVFLVVDGWDALRHCGDDLAEAITTMAAQGLAHGVHVVIAASRWAELRPALKDQLGTRIELRLGEPAESEMDRKAARHLMDSPPGAGITRDGRVSAIARPQPGTIDTLAQQLRARHAGRCAVPVRLLPALVERTSVPARGAGPTNVTIGIGESELKPVAVDFAGTSHLLVLGDSGCGKTAALRTLCTQLIRTCTPEQVQIHLVDTRRTLLGAVAAEFLAGYPISTGMVATHIAGLTEQLRDRLPGVTVTQQQLRDRSWWAGPEIYVVVDDYELIAGAGTDPLTPLLELLPHARDIGLHVVIARRAGGAARAMFNPIPATMRELGCAGLLMSAGPDDGALLGVTRPTALPPGRAILTIGGHADERVQIAWTAEP